MKKAAALANYELGLLSFELKEAIIEACDKILDGRYYSQFVAPMIQGGVGTSTNMNANEVIAKYSIRDSRT